MGGRRVFRSLETVTNSINSDKDLDVVCEMIKEVSGLGMETCVTLGMLKDYQAKKLAELGLDFYNIMLWAERKFCNIFCTIFANY